MLKYSYWKEVILCVFGNTVIFGVFRMVGAKGALLSVKELKSPQWHMGEAERTQSGRHFMHTSE